MTIQPSPCPIRSSSLLCRKCTALAVVMRRHHASRPRSAVAFCALCLPLHPRAANNALPRRPVCARGQAPQPAAAAAAAATISRRQLLLFSAVVCGAATTTAFPAQVSALSKKRILARAGPLVQLPSGVSYRDVTVGKGFVPRDGDTVAIHYSLFYKDLEVESSRESQGLAASPLGFTFGATSGPGSIMRGVNVGMEGMKVGGLRLITVPPELAFGARGKAPLIPANSTVDFAVSLLSCKRAGTNPNSVVNPKAQAY